MRRTIILTLFVFMTVSAFAQVDHYFTLMISYDNGNLSLKNIRVEPSEEKLTNTEGRYIAEVLSFQNRILNLTYFSIPTEVFFDFYDNETGVIGGGNYSLNNTEVELHVPYYANAKEINIYDWNLVERLHIDISSYAKEVTELEEPEVEEVTVEEQEKPSILEQIRESADERETSEIFTAVGFGIGLLFIMIVVLLIITKKIKRS